MTGRIRREDVEAVREQTRIDEVVGEHVTLKSAGAGSLKGLCPFHEERSPSFHVRPLVGFYHCFGCGEGGDVISFVQKAEHLSFAEAVERLAARLGYELQYEDDHGGARREDGGRRQRLLDAHRVAEEFYAEQLQGPAAAAGREFLADRGFDRAAAEVFAVGFAPAGWDALRRHLTGRGFREEELAASGLMSQGGRGLYDRFRGRLVWPIRDITGATVGFGARRLLADDPGPKYLNTPETPIYHKSRVLYGIDLAKKEIARQRQAVVVEGYTDVMACHLAGVATAVATCGTAFGSEHVKTLRRLLADDDALAGGVVFTFDGDEAGQKAALRAFAEDQRFVASTFVAVEPHGLDPCELRQQRGDDAVRALVAARQPMFEFAIRAELRRFDLETAEGRVQALRAAAPVVAAIRDTSLRPEYARRLAGWLGMDVEEVRSVVSQALRGRGAHPRGREPGQQPGPSASPGTEVGPVVAPLPRPDPHDPVAQLERQALEVLLQVPHLVPPGLVLPLESEAFTVPAYRVVREAVVGAGDLPTAPDPGWAVRVRQAAPEAVVALVTELAVTPLPIAAGASEATRYARAIVASLRDVQVGRTKAALMGQLQRMDRTVDPRRYDQLQVELLDLELQRRALREE